VFVIYHQQSTTFLLPFIQLYNLFLFFVFSIYAVFYYASKLLQFSILHFFALFESPVNLYPAQDVLPVVVETDWPSVVPD